MCVEVKTLGIPAMLTGVVLAVLVLIFCYFLPLAQAKWREWHDDVVEETEVDTSDIVILEEVKSFLVPTSSRKGL